MYNNWEQWLPTSQLTFLFSRKPLFVRPVARIKHMLRLFQSVQDTSHSGLFNTMLKPDRNVSAFYVGGDETEMTTREVDDNVRHLNSEQKRIVTSVAKLCTTDMHQPRVALLQGPPGTGKSTTITALVLQMLYRSKRINRGSPQAEFPRILLTAPSNAGKRTTIYLSVLSPNEFLSCGRTCTKASGHSPRHGQNWKIQNAEDRQGVLRKSRR